MRSRHVSQSFGSLAVRMPLATPGQRIGLLGGSFNPPHEAHVAISEAALKRLGLDRVWWLVSPGNPLKSHADLAPLSERMEQCRRLARHAHIEVTALEADLGSAVTAVTLAFLRRRYPGVRFVWLMGGDNLAGFHRWAAWRRIAASMPIAVLDRPGWSLRALASPAAQALSRYRVRAEEARTLPLRRPPAWMYMPLRLSPHASSAIRASRNATTT